MPHSFHYLLLIPGFNGRGNSRQQGLWAAMPFYVRRRMLSVTENQQKLHVEQGNGILQASNVYISGPAQMSINYGVQWGRRWRQQWCRTPLRPAGGITRCWRDRSTWQLPNTIDKQGARAHILHGEEDGDREEVLQGELGAGQGVYTASVSHSLSISLHLLSSLLLSLSSPFSLSLVCRIINGHYTTEHLIKFCTTSIKRRTLFLSLGGLIAGSFHVKSTRKMDTRHRFCRNLVSTYLTLSDVLVWNFSPWTCMVSELQAFKISKFGRFLLVHVNFDWP